MKTFKRIETYDGSHWTRLTTRYSGSGPDNTPEFRTPEEITARPGPAIPAPQFPRIVRVSERTSEPSERLAYKRLGSPEFTKHQ